MAKHIIVPMLFVIRDRAFEKVWGVENFQATGIFLCINFFRPVHEYFQGYLACMNFVHLIFPCTKIFCTQFFACPHKFSHGLSLKVIIILKAVETPVSNWCIIYVWSVRSMALHC